VRTEGKLCNPQGGGERSRPAVWPRLSKVDRRAEFALVFWVGWHPGAVVMWGLDGWLISSDVWRICLLWRHGRTGSAGHRVGWGLWRIMGRQSSFEVWMIGLFEGWLDLPCWRTPIFQSHKTYTFECLSCTPSVPLSSLVMFILHPEVPFLINWPKRNLSYRACSESLGHFWTSTCKTGDILWVPSRKLCFIASRQWISVHSFHNYCPTSVKLCVWDLHVMRAFIRGDIHSHRETRGLAPGH